MRRFGALIAILLLAVSATCSARDDGVVQVANQIEAAAGKHRVIVLGETHGTREIPRLVATLARHYAEQGPLLLAIEISTKEHAPLRDYLRAPDDRLRNSLRRGAGWTIPVQRNDGRRSEQMIELVEAMRKLHAQGRDVAILPFDSNAGDGDAQLRDRTMAATLRRAYVALPANARLLVLTGNVHAMRVQAMSCAGCQRPMTSYLVDLHPYSIRIDANAGQAWMCQGVECGPHAIGHPFAHPGSQGNESDRVYDYEAILPRFTPATPIRL
jgi:erythromycin esterase-like protein